MQVKQIDQLRGLIQKTQPNIVQMTIMQRGRTVFSEEWNGFRPNDCAHVMSVTKSVVALLVGIALEKGYLKSIDQPVLDFFPTYTVKRGEKTIYEVTIRQLMTMTAPFKYKSEPWTKVCSSEDWTIAALDLLGGRRGVTGEFQYATLGIQILCGILEKASGCSPLEFANRQLFEPLSIAPRKPFYAETAEEHKEFTLSKAPQEKVWFVDPRVIPTAGFGLCLSSSEMAKIGQLCLEKGTIDGKRLLSDAWIEQITRPSSPAMEAFGKMCYGMLWWIPNAQEKTFVASGTGGNVIYVQPALDVVVAVAATFKPTVFDRISFIEENVIPLLS